MTESLMRKSTEHDLDSVYHLICELESTELCYEDFSRIYQDQLQDDRHYFLVYETDDRIIGFLNLRFEDQLHHAARIAEILEFSVSGADRSHGVGKELFAEACSIAKLNGCEGIEAASGQNRKDAHRFYLREEMQNSHFKFTRTL